MLKKVNSKELKLNGNYVNELVNGVMKKVLYLKEGVHTTNLPTLDVKSILKSNI